MRCRRAHLRERHPRPGARLTRRRALRSRQVPLAAAGTDCGVAFPAAQGADAGPSDDLPHGMHLRCTAHDGGGPGIVDVSSEEGEIAIAGPEEDGGNGSQKRSNEANEGNEGAPVRVSVSAAAGLRPARGRCEYPKTQTSDHLRDAWIFGYSHLPAARSAARRTDDDTAVSVTSVAFVASFPGSVGFVVLRQHQRPQLTERIVVSPAGSPADDTRNRISPGRFVDFTITRHRPCHALRAGR